MVDIVPEITKESIINLAVNDKREDGRELDEYRDISIETDVISKAEGSARVKIGDTQVIVGIKPQIGAPFPDTPDLGVLMTNCEMLPMADPTFEPGPPMKIQLNLHVLLIGEFVKVNLLIWISYVLKKANMFGCYL